MRLAFGFGNSNKVIKIDVLDKNNMVAVTVEKNFVLPADDDEDNILMIKGKDLKEFEHNEIVYVIYTTKRGDRIKHTGSVSMSMERQLNIKLFRNGESEVLQERRRYFKIKSVEQGRVLFFTRNDENLRFDEPVPITMMDINIGGIFMQSEYEFMEQDLACVEIDLFIDYKLKAMAKILRVQRDPEGNILGYGCEFQGLTAGQEDYIGKYIYKVQSEQRRKEMAMEEDDY